MTRTTRRLRVFGFIAGTNLGVLVGVLVPLVLAVVFAMYGRLSDDGVFAAIEFGVFAGTFLGFSLWWSRVRTLEVASDGFRLRTGSRRVEIVRFADLRGIAFAGTRFHFEPRVGKRRTVYLEPCALVRGWDAAQRMRTDAAAQVRAGHHQVPTYDPAFIARGELETAWAQFEKDAAARDELLARFVASGGEAHYRVADVDEASLAALASNPSADPKRRVEALRALVQTSPRTAMRIADEVGASSIDDELVNEATSAVERARG